MTNKQEEEYEIIIRALYAAGVPVDITLDILTVELAKPEVLLPGGMDRMLKEKLTPGQYLKISGYDTLEMN